MGMKLNLPLKELSREFMYEISLGRVCYALPMETMSDAGSIIFSTYENLYFTGDGCLRDETG